MMKVPLVSTIAILVIGALWGAREHHVLSDLREKYQSTEKKVAALEASGDFFRSSASSKGKQRHKGHIRVNVKSIADRFVAMAREMKEAEKNQGRPNYRQIVELFDGLYSFNEEEFKAFISEVKGRTDLDEKERGQLLQYSIVTLSTKYPETALGIFTESLDLLNDRWSEHLAASMLGQWAQDQPLAAVGWIKKNAAQYPDVTGDLAKQAVVQGAAKQGFDLAFQLCNELQLSPKDMQQLSSQMARGDDILERQADYLVALRKQAAQMAEKDKEAGEKLLQGGLGELFSKITQSGFEKSVQWLGSTEITEAQKGDLVETLNYNNTKEDTGKWLDWLATQPDNGKKTEYAAHRLIQTWTSVDFKAAGDWLSSAPAGPLKEMMTHSYMETIAPYNLEAGEQWVNTLPAEKQKNALMNIYWKLKEKDKAAALEFSERHNLGQK